MTGVKVCGRFTLKVSVDTWISELLGEAMRSLVITSQVQDWRPRFNIAPTQQILVLTTNESGEYEIKPMRWGLVPSWTDSIQSSYSMVNARAETLLEKPTYKTLLPSHRCVVLADGYYEWQAPSPKNKIPFWIHRGDQKPFGMAGLWTSNSKVEPGKILESATVITVDANEDTREVHNRMPAMLLDQNEILNWLKNKKRDEDALAEEIRSVDSGTFQFYEVEKTVNNARNEGPDLIHPVNRLF